MRILLIGLAVLSPFLFPVPLTFVLSFFAGLFVPLIPLLSGALLEYLYGVPSEALPLGLLIGALLCALSFFVRGFIKTRIMWGDA